MLRVCDGTLHMIGGAIKRFGGNNRMFMRVAAYVHVQDPVALRQPYYDQRRSFGASGRTRLEAMRHGHCRYPFPVHRILPTSYSSATFCPLVTLCNGREHLAR